MRGSDRQLLAAQHMEMQVLHGLTGVLAAVRHATEAVGKAELLRELRMKTPDENKRYQKIIANKDAILAAAQAKEDSMLEEAQIHTNELVSEHEIMQQAYAQANEIVTAATEQAQEILDIASSDANEIRI